MTLKQAIETVRIALGDREEHHRDCNSRKKIPMRDENYPCNCYAAPHEAMDLVEEYIRREKRMED